VVLGQVGAGQYVGEMAAIEGRVHSATARAASDGEAAAIDVHAFLDRISAEPALAQGLIRRLSIRLREADRAIAAYRAAGSAMPAFSETGHLHPERTDAGFGITLGAETPALRQELGEAAVVVAHLPYIVGRMPEPGEHGPRRNPDLTLGDHRPLRLSREHFAIERLRDRLWVRDLSSTLGTSVNGQPIGRDFPADSAELRWGENRIVAGGAGSPFEFTVMVTELAGAEAPAEAAVAG
jgi:CRP/FNR family cyclic AMP-dependent transcriptional regulator